MLDFKVSINELNEESFYCDIDGGILVENFDALISVMIMLCVHGCGSNLEFHFISTRTNTHTLTY